MLLSEISKEKSPKSLKELDTLENFKETPQELVVVLENVEERGNEVDQGMETYQKAIKEGENPYISEQVGGGL